MLATIGFDDPGFVASNNSRAQKAVELLLATMFEERFLRFVFIEKPFYERLGMGNGERETGGRPIGRRV